MNTTIHTPLDARGVEEVLRKYHLVMQLTWRHVTREQYLRYMPLSTFNRYVANTPHSTPAGNFVEVVFGGGRGSKRDKSLFVSSRHAKSLSQGNLLEGNVGVSSRILVSGHPFSLRNAISLGTIKQQELELRNPAEFTQTGECSVFLAKIPTDEELLLRCIKIMEKVFLIGKTFCELMHGSSSTIDAMVILISCLIIQGEYQSGGVNSDEWHVPLHRAHCGAALRLSREMVGRVVKPDYPYPNNASVAAKRIFTKHDMRGSRLLPIKREIMLERLAQDPRILEIHAHMKTIEKAIASQFAS